MPGAKIIAKFINAKEINVKFVLRYIMLTMVEIEVMFIKQLPVTIKHLYNTSLMVLFVLVNP